MNGQELVPLDDHHRPGVVYVEVMRAGQRRANVRHDAIAKLVAGRQQDNVVQVARIGQPERAW